MFYCWYNCLESFVHLLGILWRPTPLDKSYSHKKFLRYTLVYLRNLLRDNTFSFPRSPITPLEDLLGILLKFLKNLLKQGSPTSGPWTDISCQISGSFRLEIKYTINVKCLNHPETIASNPRPLKTCLPQNQSLVPKRLGTAVLKNGMLCWGNIFDISEALTKNIIAMPSAYL